uniref:Histone acetyltransferase (EC) n=1 Tax=Ganoderma boninense TaxID=34458 RepID=A0A5K1JTK3_9APHY|nr:Histone acetyltransferase (EC [Ganoderma boninense]
MTQWCMYLIGWRTEDPPGKYSLNTYINHDHKQEVYVFKQRAFLQPRYLNDRNVHIEAFLPDYGVWRDLFIIPDGTICISSRARTLLVRFADVSFCDGFGAHLSKAEGPYNKHDVEWPLQEEAGDIVIHGHGTRLMRVIFWHEIDQDAGMPTEFAIRMGQPADVSQVLYEALSLRFKYDDDVDFWNVATTSWSWLPKDTYWSLDSKYTTFCIRAPGAGFTPGLGAEITHLERQHGRHCNASVPPPASPANNMLTSDADAAANATLQSPRSHISPDGVDDGAHPPPAESNLSVSLSKPAVGDKVAVSCLPPAFFWIIWFATCEPPIRITSIGYSRRCLPRHKKIPPENEIPRVLVWLANGDCWKSALLTELWLVIPSTAKRALIRLPRALDCTTFATEHCILHAELRVPEPTQWQYISLIEPVPSHNCGERLTIVAYGELDEAPKIFDVKLTKNGEIRWRDYPRLLAQVLGEAEATYPPVMFHAWYPVWDRWDEVDPDTNYKHCPDYDFLLLRSKSNERAPGLCRWVEHLAAQRYNRIGHRYSIPSIYTSSWQRKVIQTPSPVGSKYALSSMYVRTNDIVSPRPEMMRLPDRGVDDDHALLRASASIPNLRRYSTSAPDAISHFEVAASSSHVLSAGGMKPLDVARKRKTSTVNNDEEAEPGLRRSPRKHVPARTLSAESTSDRVSPRAKKAKMTRLSNQCPPPPLPFTPSLPKRHARPTRVLIGMPMYRAYTQPDNPAIYRVLGLNATGEDVELAYSRELKTACLLAAGPQPKAPPLCPRCHQLATFHSRLCYKAGLAGAWNMICQRCQKVHIPTQEGPTEKDLEEIEAIRERDLVALRARKEGKARARATKKTAKPDKASAQLKKGRKAETGQEAANKRPRVDGAEDERPFGLISNAITLGTNNDAIENLSSRTRRLGPELRAPPSSNQMQSSNLARGEIKAPHSRHPDEVRTIALVLWEKTGELPFIDQIAIPSQDELFLFHHPRVRAIPAPTQYERFVFIGKIWSPVPWDISPIEVRPEDDVIFVRVLDIQCRGFGQHLHDYQLDHGHALPIAQRLARVIYRPPKRHRWVLVWHEDRAPPKIFLFDSTLLDDPNDNVRVPRPWLDLLRDAPFFLIWHELHTRWQGVLPDQSPHVPDDAPMVLLANPAVENLKGCGEAIAWLESWRADHGFTHTNVAAERFARALTPPASASARTVLVPLRMYSKKPGGDASSPAVSDDEPEFLAEAIGSASGASATAKTRRRTTHNPPSRGPLAPIVSGDEVHDFVQGSSTTAAKPRKRRGRRLEWDLQGREVIDLTDE